MVDLGGIPIHPANLVMWTITATSWFTMVYLLKKMAMLRSTSGIHRCLLSLNQSALRFIECEDREHEALTCQVVGFLGALPLIAEITPAKLVLNSVGVSYKAAAGRLPIQRSRSCDF